MARYVAEKVEPETAATHIADLQKYLEENYPPGVPQRPFEGYEFLDRHEGQNSPFPPALDAAGLLAIPYTRYHELAAVMGRNPSGSDGETRRHSEGIQPMSGYEIPNPIPNSPFWVSRPSMEHRGRRSRSSGKMPRPGRAGQIAIMERKMGESTMRLRVLETAAGNRGMRAAAMMRGPRQEVRPDRRATPEGPLVRFNSAS